MAGAQLVSGSRPLRDAQYEAFTQAFPAVHVSAMQEMCKCGPAQAQALKPNSNTEATIEADLPSCVGFRGTSMGRNGRMLHSDLLPGFPFNPSR